METTEARPGQSTVLVFTTVLLPYSQTFIRDHVASLRRYRGVLVGFKRSNGLNIEGLDSALVGNSHIERWMLYWLGLSKSLDKIIDQTGASLVHCHFADAGALLARYCVARGIPLIVTIHGSDVLRQHPINTGTRLRQRLFRLALTRTTLFLAVSDWLLARSIDKGVPADRLRRHYLGIPLQPTSPSRQQDGATILFVGRLVKKKGLIYLLDAVRLLWEQRQDFRVRIVGDGPLRAEAEASVAKLALPITFTGARPPQEVMAEMDSADIFCVPSTTAADGDNEGLGLVFVEAQSRELPVVSFDQGPIPEAVDHGRTGLLVEDKNPQALAAALAALIDDPGRRQQMGRDGRRLAEDTFDIGHQTAALEMIYDDVLSAHVHQDRV